MLFGSISQGTTSNETRTMIMCGMVWPITEPSGRYRWGGSYLERRTYKFNKSIAASAREYQGPIWVRSERNRYPQHHPTTCRRIIDPINYHKFIDISFNISSPAFGSLFPTLIFIRYKFDHISKISVSFSAWKRLFSFFARYGSDGTR